MDERYTNSLISSIYNYLIGLQYLCKNDMNTVRDLNLFKIIHQVYSWACWFEVSEDDKLTLQKKMDCLILGNSDLVLLTPNIGNYYSNVSSPQTIHTWQRVYDNSEMVQHDIPPVTNTIIISEDDSNITYIITE